MTNQRITRSRSLGSLLAAGLVGGVIGVAALGTSQADTPSGPPAAATSSLPGPPSSVAASAVWDPTISHYASTGHAATNVAAVRARVAAVDTEGSPDAAAARDVPAPTGTGAWTVIPGDGVTCLQVDPDQQLCGHDDRLAEAGVAVLWGLPSSGQGTITFQGLAVDQVTQIEAVTDQGTAVATTTPSGSVFSLSAAVADDVVALRVSGTGGLESTVQVR